MPAGWRHLLVLAVLVAAGCTTSSTSPPPSSPATAKARAHHPRGHARFLAGPMQPERSGRPALRLSVDDVLGKPVRLGPPEQKRVTLVFLMSRESREESSELGRVVDERLLDEPVEQVSIVDVHRYGGAMRSMASWQMRKSAEQALERRKKRREEHHADASPEAVGRWHLVADFDGKLFGQLGVGQDLLHPLVFVVTPDGEVRGPYRDAEAVVAAVGRLKSARHGAAARDDRSRTASR